MSRIEERWLDTGSGPGRMVRVRVYGSEDADSAYRRILEHGTACQVCRGVGEDGKTGSSCSTAQQLHRAWRTARRPKRRC